MKAHMQMTPLLPLSMIMTYIMTLLEVRMAKGTYMNLSNLIEMSMVQQLEEMHEIIHKLNNELIAKEANEKSLEEKVVKLLVSYPTPPNTNEHHDDDA
ncbi:hypothetical protein CR513_51083, partial [Mucuna pruriens]